MNDGIENGSGSEGRVELLCKSKYLSLVQIDGWSFVRRNDQVRVVAIVAVTDENRLILVEQFRPALGRRIIELPAGLAGDVVDKDEPLQTAAERELLEETGYTATRWTELATVSSSAGLTDEVVTLFRAEGLTRVESGGGVDGEDITVHKIAVEEVAEWVRERKQLVDSRVFGALYWAQTQS